MARFIAQITHVTARLFLVVLLLTSVILAPAHAASMGAPQAETGLHATAMPCPMSGMAADHHEDVGESLPDSAGAMNHVCCTAPALGSGQRHETLVRVATVTAVEPIHDGRAALSAPSVDLQPPRA